MQKCTSLWCTNSTISHKSYYYSKWPPSALQGQRTTLESNIQVINFSVQVLQELTLTLTFPKKNSDKSLRIWNRLSNKVWSSTPQLKGQGFRGYPALFHRGRSTPVVRRCCWNDEQSVVATGQTTWGQTMLVRRLYFHICSTYPWLLVLDQPAIQKDAEDHMDSEVSKSSAGLSLLRDRSYGEHSPGSESLVLQSGPGDDEIK